MKKTSGAFPPLSEARLLSLNLEEKISRPTKIKPINQQHLAQLQTLAGYWIHISLEIDLHLIFQVFYFPTSARATILNVAVFLKSEFSEWVMISVIFFIFITLWCYITLIRADVQALPFDEGEHDKEGCWR